MLCLKTHENDVLRERMAGPAPDHIMLSISGDAKTTATVTWRTSAEVAEGCLILREKGSQGPFSRFEALCKPVGGDLETSNRHWATATGLTPGTLYEYAVGTPGCMSATYCLRTQEEKLDRFRFLLIADQQKGAPAEAPDYSLINGVIARALAQYPDCRFILTAGDNCDNGENEIQWNGMFEGLKGIIESIPFMMATGNHDNRGFVRCLPEPKGKFYLEHADFFDAQFEHSYPKNGPAGYQTENYSFDYGDAHFLIMGINAPDLVAEWAYEDLQRSDKTWKLGVYHFPVYPLMPEGQRDDGYPQLRKPVEEGRLDILFAGHEHSFGRTYPARNDELFDRPSQGTVHYIMGNAGRSPYLSNSKKVWHCCFYPQEEPVAMAGVVEIDGTKCTITAFLDDGRTVDYFALDKRSDTISPPALAPVYLRTKLAFKGYLLEMAARGIPPFMENGLWYVPFALLVQSVGGYVDKQPGKVTVGLYGKTAEFTEGSATAVTDTGSLAMPSPVLRRYGQLFMPADSCAEIFGLTWYYAARNNFINFDHNSEDKTVSPQP